MVPSPLPGWFCGYMPDVMPGSHGGYVPVMACVMGPRGVLCTQQEEEAPCKCLPLKLLLTCIGVGCGKKYGATEGRVC